MYEPQIVRLTPLSAARAGMSPVTAIKDARANATVAYRVLPVLILFLGLILCLPHLALAQGDTASIVKVEGNKTIPIGASAYLFKGEDLDWFAVSQLPSSAGEKNPNVRLNVGGHGFPLWVRFDLAVADIDPDNQWLLDTFSSFGGDMVVYLVSDGQLLQQTALSSTDVYKDRPHPNPILHFPLQLPSNQQVQLLWHITSSPVPFFMPSLTTEQQLRVFENLQIALVCFAFGFLGAMMLYHLILAGATLDKAYLAYSFYVGANALWIGMQSGVLFKYVWPNAPWFEERYAIVVTYLPVIFATLFAVLFLQLSSIAKRLAYFYYGLCAVFIGLVMLRVFNPTANVDILSLLVVITFLSYIFSGIYALKKGVVYAKFYLIAWTIYCLAITNWMFALLDLPALLPDYAYWVQIFAFDLQVMFLALALAHRIRNIQQLTLAAEADNKAKSEFLARMSHEIRTPLSGVLGMADLLYDRLRDQTDIHYVNIIRSSGKSLLTIINDILDYSKFTSGKMELENIPFNIQQLAVDSLDIFKLQAAEKNIELIADIDLELSAYLMGDPTRVKQVMLNFISNAIKFTESGEVVLSVHRVKSQKDMVKIAVTDSGVGIGESEQKNLFEAFAQASSATSRQYGGTGLGLSICKQLAHFMDGEIGVESKLGKGSTFWITARLPASEAPQPQVSTSHVQLLGLKLLIVEDNKTFADLLAAQAISWGMTCSIAGDGEAALATLETQYAQGNSFDLISLDLFMPKMDGLETSRRIEADERFRHIPRLLLTSATNFPSAATLAKTGLKKVVEKPSLPAELEQTYKQVLAGESSEKNLLPQAKTQSSHAHGMPSLSILVAEDNSVNQMVIQGFLKRLNQTVIIVENGEAALQHVTQAGTPFDLILMDCDMPVMDGITATREIRAWEANNKRPPTKIVALTAHALQSQVDECYEAGMNEYLAKPIDLPKLEAVLRTFAKAPGEILAS